MGGYQSFRIKLICLSEHVMCSFMFCAPSNITSNITPLLVHPLLPLKQQDCQCCNHYCHLFHLALLVSFEEARSLHTFDAHPRGSGRSTDKICGGHFRQRRGGLERWRRKRCPMWFAARLAAVYVAASRLGRPWGKARIWYRSGQSLIRWLQKDVDRRLRHFYISAH